MAAQPSVMNHGCPAPLRSAPKLLAEVYFAHVPVLHACQQGPGDLGLVVNWIDASPGLRPETFTTPQGASLFDLQPAGLTISQALGKHCGHLLSEPFFECYARTSMNSSIQLDWTRGGLWGGAEVADHSTRLGRRDALASLSRHGSWIRHLAPTMASVAN